MPDSRPWVVAVVAVALVLSATAGTAVGADAGTGSGVGAHGGVAVAAPPDAAGDRTYASGSTQQALDVQPVDPDLTRMEIALREDGSAAWELQLWTRLENDEDREAFETLESEIASDPGNYTARFEERMNDTVAAAEESTGREMAIRDVGVEARTEAIPEEYGVVTYTFVWEGFAVAEGGELRAGDAVDGLLLEDGTRLTITWPEAYREASVDPEPSSRATDAVVWQGDEREFVRGQPRLVVTTAPAEDGGDGTDGQDGGDGGEGESDLLPLAVGALLAVAAVGALALLVWSGRLDVGALGGDGGDGDAGASDGGAAGAAAAADESGEDEPPSDLLSNEEQVLRLLEDNGGRIKQQQVVQELDWTEAKTSQVVTSMREEGEIEVFRIGRENVLALPDETDI